jgi:hypothetical protein
MKPRVFSDIFFPITEFSQKPFESVSVTVRSSVPDPDQHGTALILVGWMKCWMFFLRGLKASHVA